MYLLDTSTCIYFIKGRYPSLLDALRERKPADIQIPSIVVAELLLGAEKSKQRIRTLEVCRKFLEPFEVVSFDDEAAVKYAEIRAALEKRGRVLGTNDVIIAATVMAHDGILVTHCTKEFKQVAGLRVEDWVRE